jgi:predicted hydrolase (HD superfamily)
MISLDAAEKLLEEKIQNPALRHHCRMVARAMRASADLVAGADADEWYAAGLLHDLDWELFPDEHPHRAVNEWLPQAGATNAMLEAILSHAPLRTGRLPQSPLDCWLFANDELSGFMHAVSLMRPTRFDGMEPKSVLKKLKDPKFAANVSREDIHEGCRLIGRPLEEHIAFLIGVFCTEL